MLRHEFIIRASSPDVIENRGLHLRQSEAVRVAWMLVAGFSSCLAGNEKQRPPQEQVEPLLRLRGRR